MTLLWLVRTGGFESVPYYGEAWDWLALLMGKELDGEVPSRGKPLFGRVRSGLASARCSPVVFRSNGD